MNPIPVRSGNVDAALRTVKRKMQRDGIAREQKERRFHVSKSEKSRKKKADAMRRRKNFLARRRMERGY